MPMHHPTFFCQVQATIHPPYIFKNHFSSKITFLMIHKCPAQMHMHCTTWKSKSFHHIEHSPDPRRRPERRGDEEMVRGRREEECEGKVGRERRERIVYTSSQGGVHNQEVPRPYPAVDLSQELEDYDGVLPRPVRRGLLWQQKDRFFSRWKERFFILTQVSQSQYCKCHLTYSQDYLHCFKKESSRITEMGGFIFKVLPLELLSCH